MTAMTDTHEADLLNHQFRSTSYTPPATWYVALHTSSGSDTTPGTEVSTSGTGYGRASITRGDAYWAAPNTSGQTSNAVAITFGTPSASWGTITHFSLWDAPTGGTRRWYGALTNPKNVGAGDPAPVFPIGSLVVQIDN